MSDPDASPKTFWIGAIVYSALLGLVLIVFLWASITKRFRRNQVKLDLVIDKQALIVEYLFKTFGVLFLVSRLTWLVFNATPPVQDDVVFVFSRIAFGFYFSAFTLVVFFWAENAHRIYYGQGPFPKTLAMIFIMFNFAVWVFQIFVMIWFVSVSAKERESAELYQANKIADVSLSFLVSLGFLLYGFVWARMRFKSSDHFDPRRCRDVLKITGTSTVFAICFLMRVILYCWRFIEVGTIPPDIYLILAFYFPEVVSVALQVYLVESSKSKTDVKNALIEDLYAGEADVTFEEGVDPRYSSGRIDKM